MGDEQESKVTLHPETVARGRQSPLTGDRDQQIADDLRYLHDHDNSPVRKACNHGFAASNLVFGMGGGLLQKVNRDTQRFAFKSSAQKRDGVWHDVFKKPLSLDKASKPGRLSLIPFDGGVTTVAEPDHHDDLLREVFKDGVMLNMSTFDEVRSRAAVSMPSVV